jgi:hypothetical protein
MQPSHRHMNMDKDNNGTRLQRLTRQIIFMRNTFQGLNIFVEKEEKDLPR